LEAEGFVAGIDDGKIRLYVSTLTFESNANMFLVRTARIPPEGAIEAIGSDSIRRLVMEFLDKETPRAKERNHGFQPGDPDAEARYMQEAIEAAIDWIPEKRVIGGPIDVLILERKTGRIRWLDVKPECKQSQRDPPSNRNQKH